MAKQNSLKVLQSK